MKAQELLEQKISNINLQRHCLAVEAIMKDLAERFGEDQKTWSLAGLLHDIDVEETRNDFSKHGIIGAQWAKENSFPEEIVKAIAAHNTVYGKAESIMEKSLICADAISGLLIASALVIPAKKLSDVKLENVLRRFKEKDFARGVDRSRIEKCSEIGITLEEFCDISLKALQKISSELGL